MKVTIDFEDELLRSVKVYAAGERMTLKAAFEQALRQLLAGPAAAGGDAPPIPVFDGRGVQPGVDLTNSTVLRNIMDAEPCRQRPRVRLRDN